MAYMNQERKKQLAPADLDNIENYNQLLIIGKGYRREVSSRVEPALARF